MAVAVHGLLLQFKLNRFSLRDWFVILFVLACEPGLEFFVLATNQLQGLGHDV
jgi:hypothetical protein